MLNFNTILTKHYEMIGYEIKQMCLLFQERIVKKAPGPIPLDPINLEEYVRVPEDLLNLWNEVSVYTWTRTLLY